MTRTILAVFESVFTAKLAVFDLLESGLSGEMIDILPRPHGALETIRPPLKKSKSIKMEVELDGLGLGMRVGAGIGGAMGITGGLLSATGAIPLVQPNIFALNEPGPDGLMMLVGLVAGMIAGMILGGLLGSLTGLNIPEEEKRQYARAARQEPVVVTVMADWDVVDPVIEILVRHDPLELTEKPFSRLQPGSSGKGLLRSEVPDSASDRR